MPNSLDNVVLLACNDAGNVVWMNTNEKPTQIGDALWHRVPRSKTSSFKQIFQRLIENGNPQTGEGLTASGDLVRGWGWRLNSKIYRVLCLFLEIPKTITLLSRQERSILQMISTGKSVKDVSEEIGLAISTVHTYLRRIRAKASLDSHESAIAFAGRYLSPIGSHRFNYNDLFEPNSESSSDFSRNIASFRGTRLAICDWQGKLVWESDPASRQIGTCIWDLVDPVQAFRFQQEIALALTTRHSTCGEYIDCKGAHFRYFAWPMNCPDHALLVLTVRIPNGIASLTARERAALSLLGKGKKSKEIAGLLDLSISSVHAILKTSRQKLELANQESLISFAARYCDPLQFPLQCVESDYRSG
ncbi:MAG: helix-turn-helix transcriptional regulator [Planctomycetota bacterium]